MLDGGFLIKKLEKTLRRFPTADDIEQYCNELRRRPELKDLELMRVYFYHAKPATESITHPIDKTILNLANSNTNVQHESLLDKLELKPDFAVRMGETVTYGWKLGQKAMKSIMTSPRPIESRDLVPNITQKGVDLRIGLDIARLSLREMVRVIVVVTGDSDFIPAFKFARREGLRIYLDTMGHGVRRDLKAHSDLVFS